MCLVSSELPQKISKKDIVCYKVVKVYGDAYCSQYEPNQRTAAPGNYGGECGVNLRYHLNSMVISPDGPGIMAYGTLRAARYEANDAWERNIILRCVIPAGTPYRKTPVCVSISGKEGWRGFYNTVAYAAEKMLPLKEVK